MITTIPAARRKARAPKWWNTFTAALPKFEIPALYPKTWTVEKAQFWINAVPAKCPFERQLWVGSMLVLYVPPLCPLNPISQQLYDIRLAAQTWLEEQPKSV